MDRREFSYFPARFTASFLRIISYSIFLFFGINPGFPSQLAFDVACHGDPGLNQESFVTNENLGETQKAPPTVIPAGTGHNPAERLQKFRA